MLKSLGQEQGTMPTVRIPSFDLKDEIEGNYVANNPFLTHLVNSLHIIFPDGENLFIRSSRYFVDSIADPRLKKRVKAFIGQEKQHQLKHQEVWDIMDAQGLDASGFAQWYNSAAYLDGLEGFIRKSIPEERYRELALSVTSALEHYTATLAETVLEGDQDLLSVVPEKTRELLMWHAAEEIEHKSVTFDLMQQVNDGQLLKAAGFAIGSYALLFYTLCGMVYFMRRDTNFKWTDLPGAMLKSVPIGGPTILRLIPRLLQYLKPSFHPDEMDNMHLAEKVFADMAKKQASA